MLLLGALTLLAAAQIATSTTPEIAAVEILGAPSGVDTEDLVQSLANHAPSGWIFVERARLDELALEVDRRRVESYFREQGYFGVEVADAEVAPGPEERITLRFVVSPGVPSLVRHVELEGAPPDSEAALRELVPLAAGSAFRYPDYIRGKEKLREYLFNAGYARVLVTGRVRVAQKTAEVAVSYKIDTGPRVKFGSVRVEGHTEVPEESIRARLAFAPGDPFDPQRLAVSEKREYELVSVGAVRFDLDERTKSAVADLALNVTDATPNELRLGGGFNFFPARSEVTLLVAYLRRRLFHPLYSFRGEVRPAISYVNLREAFEPNISASAEIRRDDLLIPRLTMTVGATFELTQYELFRTLGPTIYLGLDRPLFDDRVRASVRFEITNQDLGTDVPGELRPSIGFYDALRVGSIAPALTWDSRDDMLGPHRGLYLRLEVELGKTFTEGGGTFVAIAPEARAYVPLGTERVIVAAKARAGAAFAGDARVPATHRYFGGGSESQRGFNRRFLSPDLRVGQKLGPVGGEALLEGSIELRFDIVELAGNYVGLVAFLDAADVTARPADLDPTDLHLAVGPGLRYKTPIGPLRLDFGFRLNRKGTGQPEPDETWAYHFSLGEAF